MKKVISIIVILFITFAANAQTTTIYATGGPGVANYKTGYVFNYYGIGDYRTYPNSILVGDYNYWHGWAVFDLSSIPAGALITGYTIGYNVTAYWDVTATCYTYGYAGDVSAAACAGSASAVWSDMTSGMVIDTESYGTTTGNHVLSTTAAGNAFFTSRIGSTVTVCFTIPDCSSYGYYYFTGWSGTATTTGYHRPYLQLTYDTSACSGTVPVDTAVAYPTIANSGTPITLCLGGLAATGLTFQWQSAPDSSTWTNITGATNSIYSFTGLTSNTYYRCNVSCIAGSSTTASTGCRINYTDSSITVPGCRPAFVSTPLSTPTLSIFPNPATNELTIKTTGNSYSSYTITNLIGQQMMTGAILENDTKVNIATLPARVYFIEFSGENGDVVKKFVKM